MTNHVCPRYFINAFETFDGLVMEPEEDCDGTWCLASDVSVLEARIKELEAQIEKADEALSILEQDGQLIFCTEEEREFVWAQEEEAAARQKARKGKL